MKKEFWIALVAGSLLVLLRMVKVYMDQYATIYFMGQPYDSELWYQLRIAVVLIMGVCILKSVITKDRVTALAVVLVLFLTVGFSSLAVKDLELTSHSLYHPEITGFEQDSVWVETDQGEKIRVYCKDSELALLKALYQDGEDGIEFMYVRTIRDDMGILENVTVE